MDLQPPYTKDTVSLNVKENVPIGPAHIGALGECLTATHGILDTMLSIPLEILLALPVIFCKCMFIFPRFVADQYTRCSSYLCHCLSYEDVGLCH
jgi:hypothetical protein